MSDNKVLIGDMDRKTCIEILKRLLEVMETFDGISPSPERINALKMAIASLETDEAYQLEYESTTKNDLALIHTEGLDEGIRCAMCTNSMKSDRGCDGSCVVNNAMYKAVMDVIENHIVDTDKMVEPATKNCESCRYYGLHHEVCNYCYKCSLWTDKEPTTKNDLPHCQYTDKEIAQSFREDVETVKDLLPTTKNDLGVDAVLREKAIKWAEYFFDNYDAKAANELIMGMLRDLPSVTIRPKGHWIERHDDWGNGILTDRRYKCSVCQGKHIDPETGEWHEVFDYKYPFCPLCGADMREVVEE